MTAAKRRRYITKSAGVSPKASSEAVSRSMRSNKSSGTKPELILGRLLRKKSAITELPGNPDFVYPRAKLAVFVHGCWWHRCPVDNFPLPKRHRPYWKRKFERNVERDRINRIELESLGWIVLEIWEHEVYSDPQAVVAEITRLKARRGRPLMLIGSELAAKASLPASAR